DPGDNVGTPIHGTQRATGLLLRHPHHAVIHLDEVPQGNFMAGQLGFEDASCVKRYPERRSTVYEHSAEIQKRFKYRDFNDRCTTCSAHRSYGR
ncbi:DUF4158 domain-containing protein, partial [Streptomyces sp. NPDC002573]|uniref:DUF4158 domain-containing protein n=1 Tax=Streptomyces sp. NPDC002573 TaxID=3364651 RepID=UPI00369F4FDA